MKESYKIIIASDFHSNATACASFIQEVRQHQPDEVWLLGDYVSDYPNPWETLDLLYSLAKEVPTTWLRGNREEYFLDPSPHWMPSSKNGSLYHTQKGLRKQDLAFFASLPTTLCIQYADAPAVRIAHGSPTSTRECLYPKQANTIALMQELEESFLVVGHTHVPLIYHIDEKWIINPGSIGEGVCGNPDATYAMLNYHHGTWIPSLVSFAYPYEIEQQRICSSEFPRDAHAWAAAAYRNLETGGDCCYRLLQEAQTLAAPLPPEEEHFEEAARNLHLPILTKRISSH